MANANTNVMSIGSTRPTNSVRTVSRAAQSGAKYKSVGANKNSSFSAQLDRAGAQTEEVRQNVQDSAEVQKIDSVVEKAETAADATDVALKTTDQGQKSKKQDAPQQKTQNLDAEEIPDVPEEKIFTGVPQEVFLTAKEIIPQDVPAQDFSADVLETVPVENLQPTVAASVQIPNDTPPVENLQPTVAASVQVPNETLPVENLQPTVAASVQIQNETLPAENLQPTVAANVQIPNDTPPVENLQPTIAANVQIPNDTLPAENLQPTVAASVQIPNETLPAENLQPTVAASVQIPTDTLPAVKVEHDVENISDDEVILSENPKEVPREVPPTSNDDTTDRSSLAGAFYFFRQSTETLLATKNIPANTNSNQPANIIATPNTATNSDGDSNLMTIMPRSNSADQKAQTMLDLLGGKTWTSPQDSMRNTQDTMRNAQFVMRNEGIPLPQGFQPVNVQNQNPQPIQLPNNFQPVNVQNQQPIQPQIEIQPQTVQNQNPQPIQPQIEIQPPTVQNQNPQPVQPQIEVQPQTVQNQNPQPIQPQVEIQPQTETQTPQFAQEVQPVAVSTQPPTDVKPQQIISDMLGVDVQVEDNQPTAPITPAQQTPQQFEQGRQPTGENFQQNLTAQVSEDNNPTQPTTSNGGEIFSAHLTANNNSTPIQPTAQTQPPDAPQAPREDFNVPAQIVQQARLIRSAQNTEMVINLRPEHLGALTLRITVSQSGALNAGFYTDNAQVRAIIENSLVQLRQELNDAGLKVEDVEVYAGLSDGGLMNGQGGQAWQQNRQQRNGRRIDFSTFEDEADALAPVNESNSTDGVDYKI